MSGKQQEHRTEGVEVLAASQGVPGSVCIGTLVEAHPEEGLRVVYPGPESWDPMPARSIVPVTPDDAGKQVVLAFEQGNPQRPIVLGVLKAQPVQAQQPESLQQAKGLLSPRADRRVQVDGRSVTIDADRELILRCGKSSITLRAGGEVTIKGLKVVSRARQTNKIKGGNVLIN